MDDLSHLLWSFLLFSWTGDPLLAVLFGVLPDLIAFTPIFLYQIKKPLLKDEQFTEEYQKRFPGWMRRWAEEAYNVTHSGLALLVLGAVGVWTQQWWIFAWHVHVLMDIPTHSRKFFGTPILWPLSDWKFDGIPWSDQRVMVPNIALLVAGYAVFAYAHLS